MRFTARIPETVDLLVVSLFIIGGAANLLFGVFWLLVPLIVIVSILSIAIMATLSFVVGLACFWVASGIWHSSREVRLVGIVVSFLNFLPWAAPNLTPWIWLFFGGNAFAWILSAAIGIAAIAYFVTRRPGSASVGATASL